MRTKPGMFVLASYRAPLPLSVLGLNTCSDNVHVRFVACTKTDVAPTRAFASSMLRVLLLHELQSKANVAHLLLLMYVPQTLNYCHVLLLFYRIPAGDEPSSM